MKRSWVWVSGAVFLAVAPVAAAGEDFKLVIHDHKFEPAELHLPAGQKVKVLVQNLDAGPEEFESYTLSREKIVPGHGSTTVFLGPLKPGRYEFFGEFHKETALGAVVVEK